VNSPIDGRPVKASVCLADHSALAETVHLWNRPPLHSKGAGIFRPGGLSTGRHPSSKKFRGSGRHAMIRDGMTVRMTEAEVARDLHTVLETVSQGSEVVI